MKMLVDFFGLLKPPKFSVKRKALSPTIDDWRIDVLCKERILRGFLKYGEIDLKNDPRCFRKEMLDELLDALYYNQWSMEKGEINLCQWTRIDEGVRHLIGVLNSSGSLNLT